jgi:predicted nucleotidyltransferase
LKPVNELPVSGELRRDVDRAVAILKEEGCSEVFLFGSVVNGRTRRDSDIDIAIRSYPPDRVFHVYERLLWNLGHPTDLIDLDSRNPFAEYLERRGEPARLG